VRPLTREEIVDRERYEALRPAFRDAVIAHKRNRRLGLGDRVTLVFEDRETLRFQVQEMLRVEGITQPDGIQRELDVYNELMPGEGELSATLFIEITDPGAVRSELDRLIGLDEHVALVLGDGADEEAIPARFDPKQFEQDRIAAVQYLRFPLGVAAARRFADTRTRARVRVDHPNYRREAEIPPEVRASLVADLQGGPEPLLGAAGDPTARRGAAPAPARIRTVRPEPPRAPGHVVVEPIDPVASLLEADAGLLAELIEVVKGVAKEVVARHGSCRVETDIGADVPRMRWHVYAPVTRNRQGA
jgi:hypothetical protein